MEVFDTPSARRAGGIATGRHSPPGCVREPQHGRPCWAPGARFQPPRQMADGFWRRKAPPTEPAVVWIKHLGFVRYTGPRTAQPVGRSARRPPAEPTWFEPWKKAGNDSSRAASPTHSSGCPPAAVDGLRRPPREQIGHFRRCQLATIPPVKGWSGGLSDDRNGAASGRG